MVPQIVQQAAESQVAQVIDFGLLIAMTKGVNP
jgi:hypothetical protein